MPKIRANGVDLYYETTGNPDNPAILLIAGLGVQMIDWPDHFVDALVEAGHYLIRFDNRDIGLSTTFDGAPHDPQVVITAVLSGEKPDVRYTLVDMAADAAALLEALGIEAAHLVGVSMGGMIAQMTAINHPAKVLSLTSLMSNTGAPDVGQPTPEAMAAITSEAPSRVREEVVQHNLTNARVWASPGLFDEDRLRAMFEGAWDRVDGRQRFNAGRQFCAILATPPRDEALAGVTAPTLVVHGTADTLIGIDGGQRTANSVPGAEFVIIDGMGHDLPPPFAEIIVSAISKLVANSN